MVNATVNVLNVILREMFSGLVYMFVLRIMIIEEKTYVPHLLA